MPSHFRTVIRSTPARRPNATYDGRKVTAVVDQDGNVYL